MPLSQNTAFGPIGCDLSGNKIRLVQMDADGAKVLCTKAIAVGDEATGVTLPLADEDLDALVQAVTDGGFVGKELVLGLPSSLLDYRALSLAAMPEDELHGAAHWQLARELGIEQEQIVSDFFMVGRSTQKGRDTVELVSFGVPSDVVADLATRLEQSGVVVNAVDIPVGAIARHAMMRTYIGGSGEGDFVVVDAEDDATGIVLVADGEIRFTRKCACGLRFAMRELMQSLDLDETRTMEMLGEIGRGDDSVPRDDATKSAIERLEHHIAQRMVREVSLCIQHLKRHDRRFDPNQIFIRGSHLSPRTITSIVDGLGMVRGNWLSDINDHTADSHGPSENDWAVAVGLGLYGPVDAKNKRRAVA